MSEGELIVIALRLLVPLLIFRWNLVGGVAAMLLDGADVIIIELIGLGGFGDHYAQLDKALDSYYYLIEVVVALRWTGAWARWTAVALFAYRMVGAVLFELAGARWVLFVFPNLFEHWWIYVVAVERFWPRLYPRSGRGTAIALGLLLIPKMGQEYLLHVVEAEPWDWFKSHVVDI